MIVAESRHLRYVDKIFEENNDLSDHLANPEDGHFNSKINSTIVLA